MTTLQCKKQPIGADHMLTSSYMTALRCEKESIRQDHMD